MEEAAAGLGLDISATVLAQLIRGPGLNPQSCKAEGKREEGRETEVQDLKCHYPPPSQAKAGFSCSEDHQKGSEGKGGGIPGTPTTRVHSWGSRR